MQLKYAVYDALGRHHAAHIFEIVRDYPESHGAVKDCAACLQRTSLHQRLVDSLTAAVSSRLLHPGVGTENILDSYINGIRVLQQLDPNGGLLAAAAPPLKAYLRARPDTIRCVVRYLTQEDASTPGRSCVLADMRAPAAAAAGVDFEDLVSVDAALEVAKQWRPTAVALDNTRLRGAVSFDVVTTLVDIYGDALFVSEYKRMLGGKLMRKAGFDTAFETRTLELLKLRFAESELHHCDVMLRDMQQSRRHLQSLQPGGANAGALVTPLQPQLAAASVLICSHLFWPKRPAAELELKVPEWLQESMDAHAKAYHLAKNPRKLEFAKALGVVELELEIGGITQAFTVSPVLAALLLPFERHAVLTPAQLAAETGIPQASLMRKAIFWVQHGALLEERRPDGGVQYHRAESAPESFGAIGISPGGQSGGPIEDSEDEDAAPEGAQAQETEHSCKQFLPVIVNVLNSAKAVTLERLQKMMTLFGQHLNPKYDRSEDELLEYLDILVERQVLKCEGSLYSLAS